MLEYHLGLTNGLLSSSKHDSDQREKAQRSREQSAYRLCVSSLAGDLLLVMESGINLLRFFLFFFVEYNSEPVRNRGPLEIISH